MSEPSINQRSTNVRFRVRWLDLACAVCAVILTVACVIMFVQ